jgi:hypothetical protein
MPRDFWTGHHRSIGQPRFDSSCAVNPMPDAAALTGERTPADVERVDEQPKPDSRLDDFLSLGGDNPDRKHAAFRLMGDRLDPDAITQATGLTPDVIHRKGEPHVGSSGRHYGPWRSGLWSLDSEKGLDSSGNHLDDHLAWLLDQLEPHAHSLRRLATEQLLSADFWCGYFMGHANSGFGLSAKTIARIAALGADLSFDIYGENVEMELETWLKDAQPEG